MVRVQSRAQHDIKRGMNSGIVLLQQQQELSSFASPANKWPWRGCWLLWLVSRIFQRTLEGDKCEMKKANDLQSKDGELWFFVNSNSFPSKQVSFFKILIQCSLYLFYLTVNINNWLIRARFEQHQPAQLAWWIPESKPCSRAKIVYPYTSKTPSRTIAIVSAHKENRELETSGLEQFSKYLQFSDKRSSSSLLQSTCKILPPSS